MPVSHPADAHGYVVPRIQKCFLEFSVKAHYNSNSFFYNSIRIYTFSNSTVLVIDNYY